MQRVPWLFGALSLIGCAPAPEPSPPPPPAPRPVAAPPATASASTPPPPPAPRVALADAFKEICEGPSSMPLEVAGSRPYVTVKLAGPKGEKALRFLVDTGGNTRGLFVLRSAADELGFASEETLPKTIRIGERSIDLPPGASWSILDDTSEEAKKRSITEQSTRKRFSVGQLGAGFLSRFVLCLDPGRGRFGLADPASIEVDADKAPPVPVIMMDGNPTKARYPFVQVLITAQGQFAGGYGVLFDTGATTSMLESAKIDFQKEKHPEWPLARGAAGDADMLGGQYAEKLLRVEALSITAPSAKFPNRPEVAAGPALFLDRGNGTWNQMFGSVPYTAGSYGALANDVLGRFRILLDYRRERLWLEPVQRGPSPSASMVRVGLALRFGDDGCPTIAQITDTNDKATKDAVKVGDVLLAVEAVDACKAWHHEIQAALAGDAGSKKKLKLRRGKRELTVSVPVVDLLASPKPPG